MPNKKNQADQGRIDWNKFNQLTIPYACSTVDDSLTPCEYGNPGNPTELRHTQLYIKLSDIVENARKKFGNQLTIPSGVVIMADTLEIAPDTIVFDTPSIVIVARKIIVQGNPLLVIDKAREDSFIRILTYQVTGNPLQLSLDDPNEKNPYYVSTPDDVSNPDKKPPPFPIVFNYTKQNLAECIPSVDSKDIAEFFEDICARNSLFASFQAATRWIYDENFIGEGKDTLRWVNNCTAAVTANPDLFINEEAVPSMNNLQLQSAALLPLVETLDSNTYYIPVLSDDFYKQEISGWLTLAQSYQATLDDLEIENKIEQALQQFSNNLAQKETDTETLLESRRDNLIKEYKDLENQLAVAINRYMDQQEKVSTDREALQKAIEEFNRKQMITEILDVFVTVFTIYATACLAFIDPVAANSAPSKVTEASKKAGEANTAAINAGTRAQETSNAAGAAETAAYNFFQENGRTSVPLTQARDTARAEAERAESDYQNALGLKNIADDMLKSQMFIEQFLIPLKQISGITVWMGRTVTDGMKLNTIALNSLKSLKGLTVPNYGSTTIEGLDPDTYWDALYLNMKKQLESACKGFTEANKLLDSIQLLSVYGKSIGAKQIALIKLSNQILDITGQYLAAEASQERWKNLVEDIKSDRQSIAAKKAFVQQRYDDVKRSLFRSVAYYNNAYLYRWLSSSPVHVNLDMDYQALLTEMQKINTGLGDLLNGTGKAVRPPQDFHNVKYTVQVGSGLDQIAAFNGSDTSSWVIPMDITNGDSLSSQIAGNHSIYIDSARFILNNAETNKDGLIEVEIKTDGHYRSALNGIVYNFVSKAIALDFIYNPDKPDEPQTNWQVAKEVSQMYMRPSPYTTWTVTATQGTKLDKVTGIDIYFDGHYLRSS